MSKWLYHYIFRGVGVLVLIGMITVLCLAVASQRRDAHSRRVPVPGARP